MKASENFKKVISEHLQKMGETDPLFAESLKKENKNIDDCITYILKTVQKSGCMGFSDEEIFGMAAHYYDEDNLEVGKPIDCKVVVNHSIELTTEEREEAKKIAMERAISEERDRLRRKAEAKKQENNVMQQGSLF